MTDPPTSDPLIRLMVEADLGIPPERSMLAPLTPEQLDYRRQVGIEIAEARAKGWVLEIPSEFPG